MCECSTMARSPSRSGMADGQEVESAPQVALPGDLEVGRGNRPNEAAVEGLGEAEGAVDTVPAEAQGQLVDAQLAGVKDAKHLDPREMGLQEGAVLGQRVLAKVPGV